MPDNPINTQAQRTSGGKPKSEGLANAPQDAADGTVKSQDGPMDRPGTEAEDTEAKPRAKEQGQPEPKIDGNRGM